MSDEQSSATPTGSTIGNPREWHVAQLGARKHYAVPRALARQDRLARFYTDAWCRWGQTILRRGPRLVRALANRYHDDLPDDRVKSWTPWAIANIAWRHVLSAAGDASARAQYHVRVGRQFASRVRHQLGGFEMKPEGHAFFGFSTTSLEVLRHLRERSIPTVLAQISPGPVEHRIVAQEAERWPGWAAHVPRKQPLIEQRVRAEWTAASVVLVNSEWSKQALQQENVPEEKITVVPCAYEPPSDVEVRPPSTTGPLRVLWVGTVGLRKGIQYLVQAAILLEDADVEFTIAGSLNITRHAQRKAPDTMKFLGRVPRDHMSTLYRRADVFVLPTLSDGFGLAQLEAMAHGLPVITTRRCGRVVTDREEGLIVEPGSAESLANALRVCCADRPLLRAMAERARARAHQFSLDQYSRRLYDALSDHVAGG